MKLPELNEINAAGVDKLQAWLDQLPPPTEAVEHATRLAILIRYADLKAAEVRSERAIHNLWLPILAVVFSLWLISGGAARLCS
jgi:hypothetical protein